MGIEFGAFFVVFGALAVLVGLAGMRRSRRLRAHGVPVWAMAVRDAAPHHQRGDPDDVTVLQYELEDGRVIERIFPSASRTRGKLKPGARVLIWYDPADPEDVLIFGRESRRVDQAFLALGALLVVAGATFATVAR